MFSAWTTKQPTTEDVKPSVVETASSSNNNGSAHSRVSSPYAEVLDIVAIPSELLKRLEALEQALKLEQQQKAMLSQELQALRTSHAALNARLQALEQKSTRPVSDQIADELQHRVQERQWPGFLRPLAVAGVAYSAMKGLLFSQPQPRRIASEQSQQTNTASASLSSSTVTR